MYFNYVSIRLFTTNDCYCDGVFPNSDALLRLPCPLKNSITCRGGCWRFHTIGFKAPPDTRVTDQKVLRRSKRWAFSHQAVFPVGWGWSRFFFSVTRLLKYNSFLNCNIQWKINKLKCIIAYSSFFIKPSNFCFKKVSKILGCNKKIILSWAFDVSPLGHRS